MANSLFKAMGGNASQGMPNFVQFMQQMRGQNPRQIINNMIQEGRLTQGQLDQIQQQASGMMGQFDAFRNMFGFR